MLRHIVALTLKDSATEAEAEAIVAGLRELPSLIPGIVDLRAGRDAGLSDGNADIAFVADFEDVDAWRSYQSHPAHRALIAERIAPALAARTAIQMELP